MKELREKTARIRKNAKQRQRERDEATGRNNPPLLRDPVAFVRALSTKKPKS